MSIEVICPSISNIVSEYRRHSVNAGDSPELIQAAHTYKSALVRQHWSTLTMASISIPSDLKLNLALQVAMRAFQRSIAPLTAFSTRFNDLPLQGTDIVSVPFHPLVDTASTDFNPANGYVMGDGTQGAKNVTVNRRKYQPLGYSSSELSRQPALQVGEVLARKAEKLAFDVIQDVLGLVTLENYGAHAFAGAAGTFDLDEIATLKGIADVANWPVNGRSLIVKSAYDVNLLKDAGIKSAADFGSSEPTRNGRIKNVYGFDYHVADSLPGNSENLVGVICAKPGILVAFSPVLPAENIRNLTYEVISDPDSGLTLEYRRWGNPDYDQAREVVEVNYGFAVGEAAALKRMISALPE